MKFSSLLLLLSTFATASAYPKSNSELHTATYSFQQYVIEFNKNYSKDEYFVREKIFIKNLMLITQHNSNIHTSYTQGINQFTDFTSDEGYFGLAGHKTKTLLVNEMRNRGLESSLPLPFEIESAALLPKSVDWRGKGVVTGVKDQGSCGSCWAFAAVATLESHIAIQTQTLFELSPQEFVSCMSNPGSCGGEGGCSGATVDLAFDYAIKNGGVVQEFQFGYSSYGGEDGVCSIHPESKTNTEVQRFLRGGPDPDGIKGAVATITGYAKIPTNSYLGLLNAVAKTGPVAVSVAASPWKHYQSGVFKMPGGFVSENLDINHAVVVVGYGTDEESGLDYWLVRNSWKPTWGEHGYIRIHREDPLRVSFNGGSICGVDTTPEHGTACKGSVSNVTVCGTSGIYYDNIIPLGGTLV